MRLFQVCNSGFGENLDFRHIKSTVSSICWWNVLWFVFRRFMCLCLDYVIGLPGGSQAMSSNEIELVPWG